MTTSPHEPGVDEQDLPAVADSQQQCVVAEVLHEDGTLIWGVALVKAQQVLDRLAALKSAPGTDAATVPTNAELAERARGLDTHTVVRGWLDRHVGQVPVGGFDTRDDWLDWAASNFLADPEVAQHLTPPAPGTDSSGQAVQRVLALAEDLDSHVKPRSFHPAGTHSDGASHAYADAAARIRAAVAGPQRDGQAGQR